jgi:hypothetical protein
MTYTAEATTYADSLIAQFGSPSSDEAARLMLAAAYLAGTMAGSEATMALLRRELSGTTDRLMAEREAALEQRRDK